MTDLDQDGLEQLEERDLRLLQQGLAARPLDPARKEALLARILQRVQAPPPPLTTTLRTTEGRWVEHGPGDHRKLLRYEQGTGMASFLIRLEPGTVVQTHGHLFDEECLVLEGEVVIGEHTFREGDWHVAHKGAVHHQFGTRTGCLLFIRAEASEGPAGWLQSAR